MSQKRSTTELRAIEETLSLGRQSSRGHNPERKMVLYWGLPAPATMKKDSMRRMKRTNLQTDQRFRRYREQGEVTRDEGIPGTWRAMVVTRTEEEWLTVCSFSAEIPHHE